MDLNHKFMEMDPTFALDRCLFIEQVHQHGFAAPAPAIQIQALGRVFPSPRQTQLCLPSPGIVRRSIVGQRFEQALQFFRRQGLAGISF